MGLGAGVGVKGWAEGFKGSIREDVSLWSRTGGCSALAVSLDSG